MVYKAPLICIFGPTAVGKTKLSIVIAKELNAPIISADSIQIYKDCPIVSARATDDERKEAEHHLIDFVELEDTYSSREWRDAAMNIINTSLTPVVIVGGTLEYFTALFFQTESTVVDPELASIDTPEKSQLIWEKYSKIYPDLAIRYHPKDYRRVRKFINEKINGKPKHSKLENSVIIITLTANDKVIESRIRDRADDMIKNGLIQELEDISNRLKNLDYANRRGGVEQAIGIRLFEDNNIETAKELLINQTLRLSKSQMKHIGVMQSYGYSFNIDSSCLENFNSLVKEAIETIKKWENAPQYLNNKIETSCTLVHCKCGKLVLDKQFEEHRKSKTCRKTISYLNKNK